MKKRQKKNCTSILNTRWTECGSKPKLTDIINHARNKQFLAIIINGIPLSFIRVIYSQNELSKTTAFVKIKDKFQRKN